MAFGIAVAARLTSSDMCAIWELPVKVIIETFSDANARQYRILDWSSQCLSSPRPEVPQTSHEQLAPSMTTGARGCCDLQQDAEC